VSRPTREASAGIAQITGRIVAGVTTAGYLTLTHVETESLAGASDDLWSEFAEEWNDLPIDRYMADGGRYRRRRYSRFLLDCSSGGLTQQPHAPYKQSLAVNPLNGGVEREFEACTHAFCHNPLLRRLLIGLGRAFKQAHGGNSWNIQLLANRILASAEAAGKPAPEGRHRDGVTYVATLMINRFQVTGGCSVIYNNDGCKLAEVMLHERGQLMINDDRSTLHSVTPVWPAEGFRDGYRDVLVMLFERAESPLCSRPAPTIAGPS
jgi:hypothetical protein